MKGQDNVENESQGAKRTDNCHRSMGACIGSICKTRTGACRGGSGRHLARAKLQMKSNIAYGCRLFSFTRHAFFQSTSARVSVWCAAAPHASQKPMAGYSILRQDSQ